MRNLALYRLCGTDGATVKHSNQFLPVTRPLSFTGERERCSFHVKGGDASAWPPFWFTIDYEHREQNRDTETVRRLVTQRFRPTRPPGRSGPMDRTAGGIGGAAPASLDLYGQSRTCSLYDWSQQSLCLSQLARLLKFSIMFPVKKVFVKLGKWSFSRSRSGTVC